MSGERTKRGKPTPGLLMVRENQRRYFRAWRHFTRLKRQRRRLSAEQAMDRLDRNEEQYRRLVAMGIVDVY